MDDALDALDSDSVGTENQLPPLPPGLDISSPAIDLPPPLPLDLDLPPPQTSPPKFDFPSDLGGDGDLLDAANSLENNPKPAHQGQASDFKSIWENRKNSDPNIGTDSRDGIYGRIDRISSGKSETLMDRFSDRFGSELDREIIVLRKKEQQDLRSIKPKVEVISLPNQSNEMSFAEFVDAMDDEEFVAKVSNATGISSEKLIELDINSLNSFFISADIDQSGTLDFDEFVSAIQSYRSSDEDFRHFFNVINNLLGELPDELTNRFIESDSFELFKEVGANPDSVDRPIRSKFFLMINELLGDLPDTVMQSFIESSDFDLYKMIAERYGDE